MSTPIDILKKYWKHHSFRGPQETIINSVLSDQNTIVLLPTGLGKSICFQIPALLNDGVCIVISPLIALMQDQVENLKKKGIKAVSLSSSLNQNEIVQLFDNILYGGIKFLYLSPERLQSEFIQSKLKQLQVSLIAIDEAHCISEWGHDFRVSYRKIKVLRKIHPKVPVIALTASATTKVFEDIQHNLEIKKANFFKTSLNRSELVYHVLKTENIYYKIVSLLKGKTTPSIVYTTSRKSTKNISEYLNTKGLKASFYHGGLTFEEKQKAFKNWQSELCPIMVATNAFGMGIDKDNVTTIIHADLPFSIENYMQESGRAGRNGENSNAYLLYNKSTIHEFNNRFKNSIISIENLKKVYVNLSKFYGITYGEKPEQTYYFDINEFSKQYTHTPLLVYNAINIFEKEELIEFSKNIHKKSFLKFKLNHQQLLKYSEEHEYDSDLIKVILRTYSGLFEQLSKIDEATIASKLNITTSKVVDKLKDLYSKNIIEYQPSFFGNTLKFLVPREDNYAINSIIKNVKQRYKTKESKKEAVLNYLTTNHCRNRYLLGYFDEHIHNCDKCDVCTKTNVKEPDLNIISEQILNLLNKNPLTSKYIVDHLQFDQNSVLTTLQLLLEKDKIKLTSLNKFYINKNA